MSSSSVVRLPASPLLSCRSLASMPPKGCVGLGAESSGMNSSMSVDSSRSGGACLPGEIGGLDTLGDQPTLARPTLARPCSAPRREADRERLGAAPASLRPSMGDSRLLKEAPLVAIRRVGTGPLRLAIGESAASLKSSSSSTSAGASGVRCSGLIMGGGGGVSEADRAPDGGLRAGSPALRSM